MSSRVHHEEIRFIQDTMALANENGIGSEGEHFGFADPISQPPIEGADAPFHPGDGVLEPDGSWRALKPGEFLLGYEDEAGPAGAPAPEPLELRLNGTFMVFRKLYQDVAAFRRYLDTAAKALYGSHDAHHQDLVAAKMMGRWRSGCPVDLSPDKDDRTIAADPRRRNNFTYAGDEHSEKDPINGEGGEGSLMSVPGAKRPFLFDLPTFVKVKGGEYLFVPGVKALEGLIEQRF